MGKLFSAGSSDSSAPDFLRLDSGFSACDNSDSDSFTVGEFLSSPFVENSCSNHRRGREQRIVDSGRKNPGYSSNVPDAGVARNSADDVWREIVAGKRNEQKRKKPKEEEMTLEDFLVRTGAVERAASASASASTEMLSVKEESLLPRGNSSGVIGTESGEFTSMKGKRSLSLLDPSERAALQKQRRMIKNRESAARSRERKQAHQFELEALALRLEQENRQLISEKTERMKTRRKQIMETVIPVVEKQQNLPRIRRVQSTLW